MSLTKLLDDTDLIGRLSEVFPMQKLPVKRTILAPPLTKNYSKVGQAFDYLLRFAIQREYPDAVEASLWIAETYSMFNRDNLEVSTVTDNARDKLKKYMSDGILTDELIMSCLDLSVIDAVFRTKQEKILDELGAYNRQDIEDMRNLLSIAPIGELASYRPIILNPTFNRASHIVGGADIDLVLGDTLVDIKTTKNFNIASKDYYQVVGYYLLYKIDGVAGLGKVKLGSSKVDISKIGIYFSRYAYLYTLCVDEYSTDQVQQGIEILKLYGREYYPKQYALSGLYENDTRLKQRTLKQMIDEVNALKSVSEYHRWLDRLSSKERIIWDKHPTSKYLT